VTPAAREALASIGRALLVLAAEPDSAAAAPLDELVPVDSCGLERAARRRLERDGRLPVVKLGRRKFVRRSDVAKLVEPVPEPVRPATQIERAIAKGRAAA
jgi:hypothetical protein